ncbi:MAG: PQQ-binding-like beta-propeller repeat protein [Litorimonas sp.]
MTAKPMTDQPVPSRSSLRGVCAALLSVVLLSGCATLERLNPFDGGDGPDQGDVSGERISILELNDTLSVGGSVTPDQIVLPPVYVNTDWPQVGGNVAHAVQHTGASGPLERIWSRDVGDGSDSEGFVSAPPVIANGVIYVMDSDNTVRAYSEADQDRLWQFKIEVTESERTRTRGLSIIDRIRDPASILDRSDGIDKTGVGGGIAYDEGVLYVASGLGVLTAIDAQSGEEIWRKGVRVPLHSAPTVSDGRVFAITDDNEIMAFDASDQGAVLWTYQGIVESARMLTTPAPAVIGDVVVAPFSSGELVALRVQNGGLLWQDALASSTRLTPLAALNDIAFGPAIADGYVIATAQSGVMTAFDLRTGQRIWTQPAGSIGMPWIAGDFIFTVTTDGKLAALSKIDGSVIWIQQLENFRKPEKRKDRIVWTGPVLAGERLVAVSSRGRLVIVNPYTGALLEERKIGDAVMVPPIIANETVYLLNDKAKLIALR